MFSTISWSHFFFTLAVLLGVYYLCLLVYFRRELFYHLSTHAGSHQRTTGVTHHSNKGHTYDGDLLATSIDNREDHSGLFPLVQELLPDLKAVFQTASRKGYVKKELVFALQSKLEPYHQLKHTPFQRALNNLMETECYSECSIQLEEKDLDCLWR